MVTNSYRYGKVKAILEPRIQADGASEAWKKLNPAWANSRGESRARTTQEYESFIVTPEREPSPRGLVTILIANDENSGCYQQFCFRASDRQRWVTEREPRPVSVIEINAGVILWAKSARVLTLFRELGIETDFVVAYLPILKR